MINNKASKNISQWRLDQIPNLAGKVAVVTGANGGLGLVTCRELAAAGASVVMACRDLNKGCAAATIIRQTYPTATLRVMQLDLASLASIQQFAQSVSEQNPRLDWLINNAGVIGMPLRRTEDGFELQMGVNYLGHFALTGLLLDNLCAADAARVVTVGTSSQPHRFGSINLNDLNWRQRRYRKLAATLQAKLAFQVWGFELNRRLKEQQHKQVSSIVVHPGIAATNISLAGLKAGARLQAMQLFNKGFTQSADKGALPTLYAATAASVKGGDYIGPGGPFEIWGYPKHLKAGPLMRDRQLAAELWAQAEALTEVSYLSDV